MLAGVPRETHAGTGEETRCPTPLGRRPVVSRHPDQHSERHYPVAVRRLYRICRLLPGSVGSASVSPDCPRHCSISLLIAAIFPSTTCTASEPAR
ncbi:hypothetical protein D3C81_1945730 [compost metagenome]